MSEPNMSDRTTHIKREQDKKKWHSNNATYKVYKIKGTKKAETIKESNLEESISQERE